MELAVIGATGLVGREMLKVLEERDFDVTSLFPAASDRSEGSIVRLKNRQWRVMKVADVLEAAPAIVLFSAGGQASLEWAPKFAARGCCVIDNSSAWRMDPAVKLIVPEVNGYTLDGSEKIIANPNCSTIQLVMAIYPLHRSLGIRRIVVSTYQSVTGTGYRAVDQLESELKGENNAQRTYPHQIAYNCIPHCDVFYEEGYTREELKLVNETRKILNSPEIKITATAVRVPVLGGHSESVNLELKKSFEITQIRHLLSDMQGVKIIDNWQRNEYPMPLYARGMDDVFVGRIRKDTSVNNGLNLWIVADNLRKGAATNAVQIAEYMSKII